MSTLEHALVDLPTVTTNVLLSLQAAYLGVPVESRSLSALDRIDAIAHEVSERFRPEPEPAPVHMLIIGPPGVAKSLALREFDARVAALIEEEVGTELEREYAVRSRLAS